MAFFSELQFVLKSIWIHQHPEYQGNLENNRTGGMALPDIKAPAQEQTHSPVRQDREPRKEPSLIDELIYDKEGRNRQRSPRS